MNARCFRRLASQFPRRLTFQRRCQHTFAVDELSIPLRPTWSVNELLSSYPKPTLDDAALLRLHRLSALQPPPAGSPEFSKLKGDMEELVRLVEAVKLVDTAGVQVHQGLEHEFTSDAVQRQEGLDGPIGRELLKHAPPGRVQDGFYIIESDRRTNRDQSAD
ncbi:hypothetical protein CYLTODRAFT_425130 [Cylindrobasidium torrendii FP15055 ss-10]|uniref:Glu-AdT subunit C n=1 Tax=Cylindrobasidium torrendii FP15055 ss-10 TaxID=1314674 RepID=A0A0D7B2V6_9AGAR|nr:hypothetical protein CYLTODRAFT_425130 [Cylindrobasidium torrendii FP15055 ss-10]